MYNHNLPGDPIIATGYPQLTVAFPQPKRPEGRLSPGQCLVPLTHVIISLTRRIHQGSHQEIVRFKNGYGALITDYRLLEGLYEIIPLKFQGPGADDYEFYFRSHVDDLTWCSDPDEVVGVCEQISQLL
jgi:hypothetical protein